MTESRDLKISENNWQQVAAALKLLKPSQIDGEQLIREEERKKHHRGARHTRREAHKGGDKSVCGLVKLTSQKKKNDQRPLQQLETEAAGGGPPFWLHPFIN